jgi:hypothetical protein
MAAMVMAPDHSRAWSSRQSVNSRPRPLGTVAWIIIAPEMLARASWVLPCCPITVTQRSSLAGDHPVHHRADGRDHVRLVEAEIAEEHCHSSQMLSAAELKGKVMHPPPSAG